MTATCGKFDVCRVCRADADVTSVWKHNASQKLGPIDTKERQKMEYRQKLKAKWAAEKNVRAVSQYVIWSYSASES
jgi:hypothetical protein